MGSAVFVFLPCDDEFALVVVDYPFQFVVVEIVSHLGISE